MSSKLILTTALLSIGICGGIISANQSSQPVHAATATSSNQHSNGSLNIKNKRIEVGSKFDPMDGVIVLDKTGHDITKFIKVSMNSVNTKKEGIYGVNYEVPSKFGLNQTTKLITVEVVKKDTVKPPVNHPIEIKAENKTISLGEVFNPLAGVTATDTDGTDITKNIKVTANTVDTSKKGIYNVNYQVTGKNGDTTTKLVTISVSDAEKPKIGAITAKDRHVEVGANFDPMDGVVAIDNDGKDVTSDVTYMGQINTATPGTFAIVYQMKGNHQLSNGATKVIMVTVGDTATVTPPLDAGTLNSIKNKEIALGTKFDPMDGVQIFSQDGKDITKSIKVQFNTVDTSKPGVYAVGYAVPNEFNFAVSTKIILVTVGQTTPPSTIPDDAGTLDSIKNKTIKVGSKFDPMDGIHIYSGDGTEITSSIQVLANTVNTAVPGLYVVSYQVPNDFNFQVSTKLAWITVEK